MWTVAGVFLVVIIVGSIAVAINDWVTRRARELRAREARRFR